MTARIFGALQTYVPGFWSWKGWMETVWTDMMALLTLVEIVQGRGNKVSATDCYQQLTSNNEDREKKTKNRKRRRKREEKKTTTLSIRRWGMEWEGGASAS